jgi:hypothetical protein
MSVVSLGRIRKRFSTYRTIQTALSLCGGEKGNKNRERCDMFNRYPLSISSLFLFLGLYEPKVSFSKAFRVAYIFSTGQAQKSMCMLMLVAGLLSTAI